MLSYAAVAVVLLVSLRDQFVSSALSSNAVQHWYNNIVIPNQRHDQYALLSNHNSCNKRSDDVPT